MHVLFVSPSEAIAENSTLTWLLQDLPILGITTSWISPTVKTAELRRSIPSGTTILHLPTELPTFGRLCRYSRHYRLPIIASAIEPVYKQISNPFLAASSNSLLKSLAWRQLAFQLNRCHFVITPSREIVESLERAGLQSEHRSMPQEKTHQSLELYAALYRHVANKASYEA